ncbi:MAG TPA: response regulator [Deltaproteobacteria bacterium]|nr:response regulator [Deltaproteobacteria bacterium]
MKTVLIVDDSAMMRRIVRRAVSTGADAEILEAENGRLALDHLQANDVDVLITDLNMPVMGGEELLIELMTWPTRPQHVVVITSTATATRKLRLTRLGVDKVLGKPFQPERLFLELQPYLQDHDDGLDEVLSGLLDAALGDTLTQMLFRLAEPCDDTLPSDEPRLRAEVTLTGAWEGSLALILSEAWCATLSEELALEVTPHDLAGEIVNIVGGRVLHGLESQAGEQVGILPPVVEAWDGDGTSSDRCYRLDDLSLIGVQWTLRPRSCVEA